MFLIDRETHSFLVEEADYATITRFYATEKNRIKICLIYDGSNLRTILSFVDFSRLKNEQQYMFYLEHSNNNQIGYRREDAETVFKRFPWWSCVIVSLGVNRGNFISNVSGETTTSIVANNDIFSVLKGHGVNVFRINVPGVDSIREENRADYTCYSYMYPVHTTVTGNRIIADALIHDIIVPTWKESDPSKDHEVIYTGKRQYNPELVSGVMEYCSGIKAARIIPEDAVVGAIVMNCNPFTFGHRYLIEYAAHEVDVLYLFVVEEDKSAVPFVDRLFMVYEGTKDLSNVVVVPSGRFIISTETFYNYFEKEKDVHTAGAEDDVEIFGRYISKQLNISKRFVGQEPYDEITNSYNETMKAILPEYGVELVEIPRKKYEGEERAINATGVRKALETGNLELINKSVPSFVFDYLQKNRDTVLYRMSRLRESEVVRVEEFIQDNIDGLLAEIQSYEKVVLYSIGQDTRGIVDLLPPEFQQRVEYCDKSADERDAYFCNKKVYGRDELQTTLRDYQIVVTTTGFAKEVYEDFQLRGIEAERCVFNKVSFKNVW